RWSKRNRPTFAALPVMDSMSTSARVSSNTFIIALEGAQRERKRRGEIAGVSSIPIALHPSFLKTDDSGQVLAWPPNRRGSNFPCRFRREFAPAPLTRYPKFIGRATVLLMAAAPLPEIAGYRIRRSGVKFPRGKCPWL